MAPRAPRSVTIFGGTGFIGRYVVKHLAARDVRVRAGTRKTERGMFLKPMGRVGQIVPVPANLRHEGSLRQAMEGADGVVIAVGVLAESGRQTFRTMHVDGPGRIARLAREMGVGRLVHVSAIGADANSTSAYGRSKAEGEQAVLAAFPEAVIVRPSVVFGTEDSFLNRFAGMARYLPALPLIGGGETRFQPVYVGDVAEGIVRLLEQPRPGAVLEFGGPRVYSFAELMRYILEVTGRRRLLVPLPFDVARAMASVLQLLPFAPLTVDQVEMLKSDNVVGDGVAGLADLGIGGTTIEAMAPTYLARYRRGGRLVASRFG
jgi:uncharacterized protein YbjT (DUF2867 family)